MADSELPSVNLLNKTRRCARCKQLHDEQEYFSTTGHYRYSRCATCRFQTGRERRARIDRATKRRYTAEHYRRNKAKIQSRIAKNRIKDPMAYAIRNSLGVKRRTGEQVSVSWTDIKRILESQGNRCALTKLPFWGSDRPCGIPNWDSPSLDRMDPDGPYAVSNLRVVLFCVNAFRGRMTDDQMVKVARTLLAGAAETSPIWEQFGLLSGI